MQSAPLLLTAELRTRLHALREAANLIPVEITTLKDRLGREADRAAHDRQIRRQSVVIPGPYCFTVCYSVEVGHPAGRCRHMSMSIDRPGRAPSPEAVWLIATELGFTGDLRACVLWIEAVSTELKAVNVVQPFAS